MENKHVYALVGVFAVIVVGIYFFSDVFLMGEVPGKNTVAVNLAKHEVKVHGPSGTAVKFNDVGVGYINRNGILTKDMPVGTYTLECVGISSQTVIVKQNIAVDC